MSFDVSIHKRVRHGVTCTRWDRNVTYNLSSMFEEGGLALRDYDGAPGCAVAPVLAEWLRQAADDPERFEAHNPENGWGDFAGCVDFVRDFLVNAERFPEGIVLVS